MQLTDNEKYTIERWIKNPNLFTPTMISHITLFIMACKSGNIDAHDAQIILTKMEGWVAPANQQ